MSRPIRLALLGAGIFARNAHLPSLRALGDAFQIVAIYSPSGRSAQALVDDPANGLGDEVTVTTDLGEILGRADVEAVDVVLPIHAMPGVVEVALSAGKHVISETPIAPDLAPARPLLDVYATTRVLFPGQQWMVGENWRYEPAFVAAARLIRAGAIGRPITFHWAFSLPMTPESHYYHTAWRRDGTMPGGFVLDAGVHHMAALRLVLGEIIAVQAAVTAMRPDLPPVDTAAAVLTLDSGQSEGRGLIGTYAVTFAPDRHHSGGRPGDVPLTVVGADGVLRVSRTLLEVEVGGQIQPHLVQGLRGVEYELSAFAAAIRDGTAHANPPEAGLADLAAVMALLASSSTGQAIHLSPGSALG